ncbi:MAG: DUF4386 family protein [Pyrinomonadaceae bacterium]
MRTAISVGRVIGVLLILQLAGLIIPFVLLLPLTRGPQDQLANAAGASGQIKLAVFLLLANCALTIGISIAVWTSLQQRSEALSLWLLAASLIMFLLQAFDNVQILSIVSLSQQYNQANGPTEIFQTLAVAAGSTRRWAHYSELLAIDGWILLFYVLLYRQALVPRGLAGFGFLTALFHVAGITLPLWLGVSPVTPMGAIMTLGHLAVGSWLVFKGFTTPKPSPPESQNI